MAGASGPDGISDGLVLALDAANKVSYPGSGTGWYNLSGTVNSGSLTNGPTFSGANQGTFVFDGTDDNVQLGNASAFLPTSAITINCWAKTNVVQVYKKIFVTVAVGTQSITGVYFSLGPTTSIYLGIITNNGTQYVGTYTDPSTSAFSNFCGTYDGANIRLYLNGTLLATQAHTGTIVNTGIGRISGYDNGSEIWDGNISTFSIYNRALSTSEILQNYNATKTRFGL